MALRYYKTQINFVSDLGESTTMVYYDKYEDTLIDYDSETANKESFVLQAAVKQNKWLPLSSYSIASQLVTKTEYNRFIPDAIDPSIYEEDVTPPIEEGGVEII